MTSRKKTMTSRKKTKRRRSVTKGSLRAEDLFEWVIPSGTKGWSYRGTKPWGFPPYTDVEKRASQLARIWAQIEKQATDPEWIQKRIDEGDLPGWPKAPDWMNQQTKGRFERRQWRKGSPSKFFRELGRDGLATDETRGSLTAQKEYNWRLNRMVQAFVFDTANLPELRHYFGDKVRGKGKGRPNTAADIQSALTAYLKVRGLPSAIAGMVQYSRNVLDKAIEQIRQIVAHQQGDEYFQRLTHLWTKTASRLYGPRLDDVVAIEKGAPGQPDIQYRLYACQQEAVWWMLNAHRGLLAHDMGLGKTLASLVAFNIMQQGFPGFQVDIVGPGKDLMKVVWQREAALFPDLKARFAYPDVLTERMAPLVREKRPQGFGVIFDEAHLYQNMSAQRTLGALDLVQGNIMKPSLVLTRSKIGGLQGLGWEAKVQMAESDSAFPVIAYDAASLATGDDLRPAINIAEELEQTLDRMIATVGPDGQRYGGADFPDEWYMWNGLKPPADHTQAGPDFGLIRRQRDLAQELERQRERLVLGLWRDAGPQRPRTSPNDARNFAWRVKKLRLIAQYVSGILHNERATGYKLFISRARAAKWEGISPVDKNDPPWTIDMQGDGVRTPLNLKELFGLTEEDYVTLKVLASTNSWVLLDRNDRSLAPQIEALFRKTPWRAPMIGTPTMPRDAARGQYGGHGPGFIPTIVNQSNFAVVVDDAGEAKVQVPAARMRAADAEFGIKDLLLQIFLHEAILKNFYADTGSYRLNLDHGSTGRFASQADYRTVPTIPRLQILRWAKDGNIEVKGGLRKALKKYNEEHRAFYKDPNAEDPEAYKNGAPPYGAKDRLHNPADGLVTTKELAKVTESYADTQYWWQRGGNEPVSVMLLTGTPLKNADPDQLWPLLKLALNPLTQLNIVYDDSDPPNRRFMTPEMALDGFRRRFVEAGLEGGILYLHEQLSDRGPNESPRGGMLWRSKNARHELLLVPVVDEEGQKKLKELRDLREDLPQDEAFVEMVEPGRLAVAGLDPEGRPRRVGLLGGRGPVGWEPAVRRRGVGPQAMPQPVWAQPILAADLREDLKDALEKDKFLFPADDKADFLIDFMSDPVDTYLGLDDPKTAMGAFRKDFIAKVVFEARKQDIIKTHQVFETDASGNRVPARWYSTDVAFCLPGLGEKERHFVQVQGRPEEEDALNKALSAANLKYILKALENDKAPSPFGAVGTKVNAAKDMMARIKADTTVALAIKFMKAGEKVVIFTASKEAAKLMGDLLTKWLLAQKKGYREALVMTGDVDQPGRQQQKNLFQNDKRYRVFVLMYAVGSVGYTLTAGARLILNDRPWQPADIRQAEDRIYRIGQLRAPQVYWIQLPLGARTNRTIGGRRYENLTFEETLDLKNLSKITAMEQLLAGEVLGGLEADVEYAGYEERREAEEIIAHREKKPLLAALEIVSPRRPMIVKKEAGGVGFVFVREGQTLKEAGLKAKTPTDYYPVNIVAVQPMNKAAWLLFFDKGADALPRDTAGLTFIQRIARDPQIPTDDAPGDWPAPPGKMVNAVTIRTPAMLPDLFVTIDEDAQITGLGLSPGCGEQCDIKSPGWADLAEWYKNANAPSVKVAGVVKGEMAAYSCGSSASCWLRKDKRPGPLTSASLKGTKLRSTQKRLAQKLARFLTDGAGPIEHGRGIWKPETFVKVARETRTLPGGRPPEILYKVQSVIYGEPQESVIVFDAQNAATLFVRLSRPLDLMMQARLKEAAL